MKNSFLTLSLLTAFVSASALADNTSLELTLNTNDSGIKIQPTMYGVFFEDINFAADGGLYAELIKNRSFEFDQPLMGWQQPQTQLLQSNQNSGEATIVNQNTTLNQNDEHHRHFARVIVNNDANYSLINEGFRGIGVKKNARYFFSLLAANPDQDIKEIHVALIGSKGQLLAETNVSPNANDWKKYEAQLIAKDTDEKASLKLTFSGKGKIDMDMISLFPEDTWKHRSGGLRKDIAQLIADLKPGFIRFPGGCIVEGRNLAQRYQWKKTTGNASERETAINRWNTEFKHRPAPDYFQSFGLGFFEYFQFAEDVGASPLPILSCGIACQFNTGELVPMNQLDPYIQDALDLIEFANGDTNTPWGKVRADMGHPKPFHLTMLGVGNEQWGPQYIERFKAFQSVLKQNHPEIRLVSGAGPMPDGDQFEFAYRELKKLNVEIVDEHYYKDPEWFFTNTTRYDNYDRTGPKVFAGEYAAQSKAVVSPDNKNNWKTALSEAAFMTGLERNADMVQMTSYAPLLAHEEAWQWKPDLIWFNNLSAYGTANYYVQKLFSNNKGTDLLKITVENAPVTGQHQIYATAVKNAATQEVIIKLVNAAANEQKVAINLSNQSVATSAKISWLTAPNLDAENSFENPTFISPTTEKITTGSHSLQLALKPQSLAVIRLKVK